VRRSSRGTSCELQDSIGLNGFVDGLGRLGRSASLGLSGAVDNPPTTRATDRQGDRPDDG